jgi:hypothetical protein
MPEGEEETACKIAHLLGSMANQKENTGHFYLSRKQRKQERYQSWRSWKPSDQGEAFETIRIPY